MSSVWYEVAMIQETLVPGKHDMVALMLALKEAEIKVGDIPLHMHHVHNATTKLK